MRGKTFRGAWLLVALLALAPQAVLGQSPGYAPADPQIPLPLGSTRPEDGGLYLSAEYAMYRQTNPLGNQTVAVRGFYVWDSSIPGFNAGDFVGSRAQALNVNQLSSQEFYQPGVKLGIGWKFKDASSLSLNWFWLSSANTRAASTNARFNANVGQNFADSYTTAFVYNFPPEYAGPDFKIPGDGTITPSPQVAYGVWDAATIMTIKFEQRFQQWDLTYRYPLWEGEDTRCSAIVGPRFAWIWERFKWRSTSVGSDAAGNITGGPDDVGIYTNITSNRMYGVFGGAQTECYLGHGFAVLMEVQGAMYLNSVKERAKYELGDKFAGLPENKNARREFTLVPEVSAMVSLQWFPTEFIEFRLGYEVMAFFNTLGSREPIDFDYQSLQPKWDHINRIFDGFRAGVAITF